MGSSEQIKLNVSRAWRGVACTDRTRALTARPSAATEVGDFILEWKTWLVLAEAIGGNWSRKDAGNEMKQKRAINKNHGLFERTASCLI